MKSGELERRYCQGQLKHLTLLTLKNSQLQQRDGSIENCSLCQVLCHTKPTRSAVFICKMCQLCIFGQQAVHSRNAFVVNKTAVSMCVCVCHGTCF